MTAADPVDWDQFARDCHTWADWDRHVTDAIHLTHHDNDHWDRQIATAARTHTTETLRHATAIYLDLAAALLAAAAAITCQLTGHPTLTVDLAALVVAILGWTGLHWLQSLERVWAAHEAVLIARKIRDLQRGTP